MNSSRRVRGSLKRMAGGLAAFAITNHAYDRSFRHFDGDFFALAIGGQKLFLRHRTLPIVSVMNNRSVSGVEGRKVVGHSLPMPWTAFTARDVGTQRWKAIQNAGTAKPTQNGHHH